MPAAFYCQGKMQAAADFTTVPFGLTVVFALSHFRTANRFPLRLEMLPSTSPGSRPAARKTAADVLGELAARGDMARKVHDSYAAFAARTAAWSRVSIRAVLEAREG